MIKTDLVWLGWNGDGTTSEAIEVVTRTKPSPYTVMISYIDSTPVTLTRMAEVLKAESIPYGILEQAVYASAKVISPILERGQFLTGFDEVWLLQNTPRTPPPAGLRICSTQPITDLTESWRQQLERLAGWMRAEECLVGLGDGIGLNFIATDHELAVALSSNGILELRIPSG